MRNFILGAATVYLVTAVMAGFAMHRGIPALNALGVAYVGLTYPVGMFCVASGLDCSSVPPERFARYFFTFDE